MASSGKFYDAYAPQLSLDDLCEVLGETADTINNWGRFGYLKPAVIVEGARRTPVRRYSIIDATRGSLIAACVRVAGLKPGHASEIADFCAPIIDEHFERDIWGERVSDVVRMVVSQLQPDGRLVSWAVYRRPAEYFFYDDDPDLKPNAVARSFPVDAPFVVIPLTMMLYRVLHSACALLEAQNRGAIELGLPGLIFADEARTRLAGLSADETREFRRLLRTVELPKLRHNQKYWGLYEKYERAALKQQMQDAATA